MPAPFSALALVAAAAALLPSGAGAATLEEIIVTAQRRAENLQEVPVSVTALSETAIDKADVHDLTTLAREVPGLTFAPFSPGQNIVSLRGAASNDDGAGTDNSVAMFIDDVYLGRVSNINPEMFDVERIEVLRGPQGTLYGKNTIGGAINVVSTKPDLDSMSGKVKLNVGNYKRTDFAAYVNGPLSERLAGKIAFSLRRRDGWVDNVFLNKQLKDDNVRGMRGQLLWRSDGFEALFSADYQKLDIEDMARTPVNTGYHETVGLDDRLLDDGVNYADYFDVVGAADYLGTNTEDDDERTDPADNVDPATWWPRYAQFCGVEVNPDCSANPVDGYAEREAQGVSARLSWQLGDGELISITAVRSSEADWNMDSTGTPGGGGLAGLPLVDDILDKTDQISQEVRWVSRVGENIDYVSGFWFLSEETDRTECFDLSLDSDCTPTADGESPSDAETTTDVRTMGLRYETDWYRQVNETTSFALFGHMDWRISERWKLGAGVRYSADEKSIENFARRGDFVIINQTFENTAEESWNALTPKLTLTYTADDWSAYGLISQGFKSGGFPAAPQTIAATAPLEQEEALNLELGVKADIADALRVNVAAFQTEYTDLQLQSFGPVPGAEDFGQFRSFNAGDAEILGVEVEATYVISERWLLSGFYGFQDSELVDVFVPNATFSDQSGQDMIRTPKHKFDINLERVWSLPGGGELAFDLSWYHVSQQRQELEPWARTGAYHLLDAQVTWVDAADRFKVSLWSRNLGDEVYTTHMYTVANSVVAVYGEPLMVGVSAIYGF